MQSLTLITFTLLAFILYLGWGAYYHSNPTKGEAIAKYNDKNTALLIVDVQEEYTQHPKLYPDDEIQKMIEAINEIQADFARRDLPIYYIKHEFKGIATRGLVQIMNKGIGLKNSGIDSRITRHNSRVFAKTHGDAMSSKELLSELSKRKVNKLILVGIDGNICIKLTAEGALSRGFEVELSTAGIVSMIPDQWQKTTKSLLTKGAVLKPAPGEPLAKAENR